MKLAMDEEMQTVLAAGCQKAISPERDRTQSRVLVWVVGTLLVGVMVVELCLLPWGKMPSRRLWEAAAFSFAFALLTWMLHAATGPAAALGGVICMNLLLVQPTAWLDTAMPALLTLFVLTFAATRFGRASKEAMGAAETRQGRRASQVVANLGIAGLCAAGVPAAWLAACVAALAEAAADTVSSEMGQALGGRTWLITTGRRVATGMDGGVSLMGTMFGVSAAVAVTAVAVLLGTISPGTALIVFGAGVAGLIFDSVLGATVERRGWMGNDWVNFASTAFAAILAYALAQLASRR